ncbi:hypothetical protein QR680_001603 [Steinernema hermaphroditum]|uniref:LITAF domain-containing protein n=1 Tax=Steinernema hermaphroditum TaxID=289476 RepID=A0AA39LGF5_9BILA|nr:hypothetical protein QR680_001603 [Steinernema hermaphroditum]
MHLLLLSFAPIFFVCSTPVAANVIQPTSINVIRHKIAILLYHSKSGDPEKTERQVQSIFNEVLGEPVVENGTQFQITAKIISADGGDVNRLTNRLQVTKDVVCGKLLNKSIAVVLLQHGENHPEVFSSIYATAAYALGFYRLPTIGVMIQDAEFSRKTVYPTFLRTSPPFSYEANVITKLLNSLAYRQVIVIHINGDVNGLEFVTVFEAKRLKFKIHVQKYIELDLTSKNLSESIERHFEELTSNVVVLYAEREATERILEAAEKFVGIGKLWIVTEGASKARNLPEGILSVKLRQNSLSAFRDALIVIRNGIKFLSEKGTTVYPPEQCSNSTIIEDEWTREVGMHFYRYLISHIVYGDNQIRFNEKGDRKSVFYEIVNKRNGQFHAVGVMNDNGELSIDERLIEWLGQGPKPLEITLPKHLRAVTVRDPPFVYTVPTEDSHTCAEFRTLTLDGIDVPGPWIPCPVKTSSGGREMFCCAGYAIDLLSNLSLPETQSHPSIDTGFTFDIHLNESYGAVMLGENGYYLSGVIGELDTDNADLAIGALTINPEREQYIDFSEPWLYHGIRILEKWKPRDSPMESFLQPLKGTLWTTLFVSVFLVGLGIFMLDLKSPFDRFYKVDKTQLDPNDPFWERSDDDRVTFGESMWFVWGVLLNSGVSEKTPRSFSARVLGIVWCGFCMIMVASYTANLAAFLVLDQPEKGLTGVTDPRLRNPSANFSFATVLETNTYQYFKRHVELSTMFRKMEGHNVRNADDAIKSLLNETLGAFIWDSTRLEFEAARDCRLRTRGTLFGRSAYGVGLQKNSPWTPHITMAILRLSESGMMENLDSKWISSAGRSGGCIQETHKSPARLGLTNMRDVFILVFGGVIIGGILSGIEVNSGAKKASNAKREKLAIQYALKWRRLVRNRKQLLEGYHGLPPPTLRSSIPHFATRSKTKSVRYANDLTEWDTPPNVLVAETDLNFRTKPVRVYCSRCRNLVDTVPQPVTGVFVYVSMAIFIVLFLWPCAPIPCFLTCFADFVHKCPVCKHQIGRYVRGRGSRFFV